MELSKLTSEQLITLNSDLSSKDEIIKFLVSKLYQAGKISNEEDFYQAVLERESLTPTGIDNGLAIPHGKDGVVMLSFPIAPDHKKFLSPKPKH